MSTEDEKKTRMLSSLSEGMKRLRLSGTFCDHWTVGPDGTLTPRGLHHIRPPFTPERSEIGMDWRQDHGSMIGAVKKRDNLWCRETDLLLYCFEVLSETDSDSE